MDQYIFPLFILLTGILFGITLLILNNIQPSNTWKKTTKAKLLDLNSRFKSNDVNALKIALMEADKLLDYVLTQYGIPGDTLGDRLKNAKESIVGKEIKKGQKVSNSEWNKRKRNKDLYNKIWEAHKLRNKLAHELNFEVKNKDLKTSYTNLKRGIKHFL